MTNRPMSLDLSVADDPDPADIAALEARVSESTDHLLGHAPPVPLAVLHHGSTGELRAGIYGWTWGGSCELQHLWVHESLRNRGVAAQLLEAAEAEALRRGCTQVVLFAHAANSGQDGRRWTRAGYALVAEVADYPLGDAARWYLKVLGPATTNDSVAIADNRATTRMVMRTL